MATKKITLNELRSLVKEIINEQTDYTGNLGRANNEEVAKVIPLIQQLAGNDIKNIITKITAQIQAGKMQDTDTRNIATAIGSIAFNVMG
jgi:hypothetical protein